MAFTAQGKVFINGTSGTVEYNGVTNTGIITSAPAQHGHTRDEVKGQSGDFAGIVAHGEMMDLPIEVVPSGDADANARASAKLPVVLQKVTLAGWPVIAIGNLSDAFNHGNWMYAGDGQVRLTSEGRATMTMTLIYRKGISPASL
jgi:hypothetical protein